VELLTPNLLNVAPRMLPLPTVEIPTLHLAIAAQLALRALGPVSVVLLAVLDQEEVAEHEVLAAFKERETSLVT